MSPEPLINSIINTPELISKLESMFIKLTQAIEKLSTDSGKAGAAVNTLKKATGEVGVSLKTAAESTDYFSVGLGGLQKLVSDGSKHVAKFASDNKDLVSSAASSMVALGMFSKSAGDGVSALKDLGKGFEEVNKTSEGFAKRLTGAMGTSETAEKMKQFTIQYYNIIGSVKRYESALFSAAQQGGNFYRITEEGGKGLVGNMDTNLAAISQKAAESAALLGISFDESLKRIIKVTRELPGEFNRTFNDIKINGQQVIMTSDQVLSTVAVGVGISFDEASEIAKEMLGTFGESARGAATRMGVLLKASHETKIGFKDIKELVTGLDKEFAMYGNQMNGVVTILKNVSKALDGTNVGFKGQIEIARALGNAIAKMELPMRAFIGLSSGMRSAGGAIGVGLNVERMLQEGKTGEIMSMMQETLVKKSGRGAITLQEASEDPRQQRAFMLQRGLLGQMGITGTGAQNRVLESMSKADLGEGTMDAEAALSDALQGGTDMAKRQTNVQEHLVEVSWELAKTLKATTLYKGERERPGYDASGRSLFTADQLSEQRGSQAKAAAAPNFQVVAKDVDADVAAKEAASRAVKGMLASTIGMKDVVSNTAKTITDGTLKELSKLSPAFGSLIKIVDDVTKSMGKLSDAFGGGLSSLDISGDKGVPFSPLNSKENGAADFKIPPNTYRGLSANSFGTLPYPGNQQPVTVKIDPVTMNINIIENGSITANQTFEIVASRCITDKGLPG